MVVLMRLYQLEDWFISYKHMPSLVKKLKLSKFVLTDSITIQRIHLWSYIQKWMLVQLPSRLLNSKDRKIYLLKWMTMIVSQMTMVLSKSINHSVSPWWGGSFLPSHRWRGSALHLSYTVKRGGKNI